MPIRNLTPVQFAIAGALIIGLAACGADVDPIGPAPSPTPAPPAPPSPAPTPSGETLTGTVVDVGASGDRRPVPNLRLKVRAAGPTDGAVGGVELADVITDANGRYEITGITTWVIFIQTAPGSDYKFLCDSYPVAVPVRPSFLSDLPVVNATWSDDRLPPGLWWLVGTSVWGRVSERVGEMLQPVGGATVWLDGGTQDPPATTNASGFYMICSVVGTDQYRTIAAGKDGYRLVSRPILGGWQNRVDLEIGRLDHAR